MNFCIVCFLVLISLLSPDVIKYQNIKYVELKELIKLASGIVSTTEER